MTNQIVQVNVSLTQAPTPSTLQRTGALISQGGTTGEAGSLSLLTQLGDLTPLLSGAVSISSASWLGGTVTVTTSAPHGFPVGQTIELTIAGMTPAGYNGTYAGTILNATQFTYPLVSNPGSATVFGAVTDADVTELTAMATTFFAQGNGVSVYVLELGEGDPAHGVTALQTFITNNPRTIYRYLVPTAWADESTFLTFIAQFNNTTALTYFHVTASLSNYTSFTALDKCVIALIEAPTTPDVEFTSAAPFYVALNYDPSTTNQVTPFGFAFLFGVTPYPTRGNAPLLATLKAANINVVGTGAEGGISNTILLYGFQMDGRQLNYWYSVDWFQINIQLDLANEVINGSNNPLAPLYYDQNGINRLQARAQATTNRGISFGLALAPANVQAVPFAPYVAQNPGDFKIGKYAGLSLVYAPNRGFTEIIFNINVTDFPVAA